MTDVTAYLAIGISFVAVVISLLGYIEERAKRRLLEKSYLEEQAKRLLLQKMVRQLVRLVRSQERQVKALSAGNVAKSPDEIKLERDRLAWDQMKTVGRALGFDVDE